MALRLLILTAELDPPPQVLMKGRRATLGRGEDCDVRLPDPSVSRHHATIVKRGATFLLMDEGSAHGTAVVSDDDQPVYLAKDCPRVLKEGDLLWLGQIQLLVRLEAAKRGEPSGYEELPTTLVRAGLEAAGFEATKDLVASTLDELTHLEDDPIDEKPPPPHPEFDWTEELGVSALSENDRHPPWITDTFVALMALAVAGGCVWGLMRLMVTN